MDPKKIDEILREKVLLSKIPPSKFPDYGFPSWARDLDIEVSMEDLETLKAFRWAFEVKGEKIRASQALTICTLAKMPLPIWVNDFFSQAFNRYFNQGEKLERTLALKGSGKRGGGSSLTKLQRQDDHERFALHVFRLTTWTNISRARAYQAVAKRPGCYLSERELRAVFLSRQDFLESFREILLQTPMSERKKYLKTFPKYSLPENLKILPKS